MTATEPHLDGPARGGGGRRTAFAAHAAGAAGALFLADAVRCAEGEAEWRLAASTLALGVLGAAAAGAALAPASSFLARLALRRESSGRDIPTAARLWTLACLFLAAALVVFASRSLRGFDFLLGTAWALGNALALGILAAVWLGLGRALAARRAVAVPGRLGRRALAVWPLLWAAGLAAARPEAPGAPSARPDVLLVVLDGLRADRCSAYGGPRGATPNLDCLAAEGALFARALAPSSWSVPSHASLLTGLPARSHGVGSTRVHLLPETRTLAEELRSRGYRTAAFTGNPLLSPSLGITRGFEVLLDSSRLNLTRPILLEAAGRIRRRFLDRTGQGGLDRQGAFLLDALEEWLEGTGADGRPLFLLVSLLEAKPPHAAPGSPGPTEEDGGNGEVDRYDEGVRRVDGLLGRLVSILGRPGSLERSLLVVTSGHGESLEEEGTPGRAGAPHPIAARVPLVVRCPPAIPAGTRVSDPVSLTQVVATALGFVDGNSRPGELFEPPGDAPVVCEYAPWEPSLRTDGPRPHRGLYSERGEAWEILEWTGPGDPLERGEGPGLAELRERLRRWDETTPRAKVEAGAQIDRGLLRDLRRLGTVER
ncbi:MAG TPA: sulfatase [Planctomycetota bacterium]|jgi:arylsulfatase A|nr:sulfatase [Planctomycetota bacterium]